MQSVVIKGNISTPCMVTSGVPQRSVLGPTLFLLYINGLPKALTCNVSLYTDDTLIYQKVNSREKSMEFQKNIDAVYQ